MAISSASSARTGARTQATGTVQTPQTAGDSAGDEPRRERAGRMTVAELARAAGVNKSTVSRALRGDPGINRETRQRIQQLADELHYEPNASARRLFHARTDVLAFTAHALSRDETSDPFTIDLLDAIVAEAGERKLDLLLCRPERGDNELNLYRRIVGGCYADGFILMDLRPDDPRLPYLCGKRFPHVLFGRPAEDLEESRRYPYPWVEVDNRTGARAGTEHLLALGHTRIAFIGGDDAYICNRDRLAGYRDALAAANVACDDKLCDARGVTLEDGFRVTRALLEREHPPTAIFAGSDLVAVGAMRAAQEAGLRVGRMFPIVGFDGLGLGNYVSPSLTTLRQPIRAVGRLLVRLLADALDTATADRTGDRARDHNDSAPRAEPVEREKHHLVQPELLVRASTTAT